MTYSSKMSFPLGALTMAMLLAGCAHDREDRSATRTHSTTMEAEREERAQQGEHPTRPVDPHSAMSETATPEQRPATTAMDQSNDPEDVKLTQMIRQALVREPDLSFAARNVTIITRDRRVMLKGPVNSSTERATVARLATGIAGPASVDDQLEVRSNP